jgi:hypothetical protein
MSSMHLIKIALAEDSPAVMPFVLMRGPGVVFGHRTFLLLHRQEQNS